MRILALKTQGLVLPFIHDCMVQAFRDLGAEVREAPIPHSTEEIGVLLKKSRSRFDAGFLLDMGNDAAFIQNFRNIQVSLKFPWIIWFVDDPEGYDFPRSCEPEWTWVFCWDREISRHLSIDEAYKGRSVIHLPLAAAREVSPNEEPRPAVDFPGGVFVGSTHHRNPFLQKASAMPEFEKDQEALWKKFKNDFSQPLQDLVWGHLAKKVGTSIARLRQDPLGRIWVQACLFKLGFVKRREVVLRVLNKGAVFGDKGWRKIMGSGYQGEVPYGPELGRIYNRSSFVLDIRQPQARTGLTQRVFDAGACGVPVLTEWSPELEDLFDPEPELFSFRTIEEAIQKRKALLQSYQTARKKAERARERILRDHTYRNRARQILKVFRP